MLACPTGGGIDLHQAARGARGDSGSGKTSRPSACGRRHQYAVRM